MTPQRGCHLAFFEPEKKNCQGKGEFIFRALTVLSFMAEYHTFATRFEKILFKLKSG